MGRDEMRRNDRDVKKERGRRRAKKKNLSN